MASDRSTRRTILLDTGPLMTYMVLLLLESEKKPKVVQDAIFRSLRPAPFTQLSRDRMLTAFRRFDLSTTSQSVQEALNTRAHSELKKIEERYRRFFCSEIKRGILEIPCSVAALMDDGYHDLICRYGLADAALLFAGAKQRCLVLTDEVRLFGALPAEAHYTLRTLDRFLEPEE